MADTFKDVIEAIVALIVLIMLFYIFYTTPSPIQTSFQHTTNEIILGIVIAVIVAIAIVLALKYLSGGEHGIYLK
jgi:hypothetical protein